MNSIPNQLISEVWLYHCVRCRSWGANPFVKKLDFRIRYNSFYCLEHQYRRPLDRLTKDIFRWARNPFMSSITGSYA